MEFVSLHRLSRLREWISAARVTRCKNSSFSPALHISEPAAPDQGEARCEDRNPGQHRQASQNFLASSPRRPAKPARELLRLSPAGFRFASCPGSMMYESHHLNPG